jgi:2,3-dihydroxybiphenyl 1,2-dioxygenase
MGLVRNLGYIGVGASDVEAWRPFATDILGLQIGEPPAASPGDESLYLRMDGRAYRLAIEPGDDGALHYLGFEVGTQGDLVELVSSLRAKGFAVTDETPEVCAKRRVATMASTVDPAGFRLEFFVGHEEATAPFVSPTGASFVVGEIGVGHAVIVVPDVQKHLDYFIDILGFRLSDTIGLAPGMDAYFLHCNPRHHTVAVASFAGAPSHLNHIMLQVESIDSLGYAYDKVNAMGIPIVSSIGKHTNDHMVSFYCKTPSGFVVEYGIEGRLVDDDTWVVGHYTAASYWGHKAPEHAGVG